MGHRLLHQSHASGRIGAFFARSKDTRGYREKVEVHGNLPLPGCPKSSDRFAILRDSARYPSGPRERSAKPPFVGSNPTRASKLAVSNQWITTFSSFPESPTWEHLGTTAKRASSSLSIARLCVTGIACVYKFSVVSMVAYPNCCCAILAGTPISCRTKACMWRSFMPRFEEIRTTCARRLRMRPRERDFPHRFSALGLPESG